MLDLDNMRILVRRGLGDQSVTDLPDVDVDRYLNMSLWHLYLKFPFRERECRIFTDTVDGVSEYGLPEDTLLDSIITVAIKDGAEAVENQWKKLVKISKDSYDEQHNTLAANREKPTMYHRLRHTLIVDPVPDAVYTIRIIFWRTIITLLTGSVETTGLPPNWDELVVEGAVERGHFYSEDYALAAAVQNFQQTKVRDAVLIKDKEKVDGRYAGLSVQWDDPRDQ